MTSPPHADPAERSSALAARAVNELLAEFLVERRQQQLPRAVVEEGKRLLLQGLTTTLEANEHSGTKILRDWALGVASTARPAHLLWTDRTTASEDATLVNAAQWYLLQLDPSHSKSGVKPVGQAAAASLAEGETTGADGATVLRAMMLALETGLVITRRSSRAATATAASPTCRSTALSPLPQRRPSCATSPSPKSRTRSGSR